MATMCPRKPRQRQLHTGGQVLEKWTCLSCQRAQFTGDLMAGPAADGHSSQRNLWRLGRLSSGPKHKTHTRANGSPATRRWARPPQVLRSSIASGGRIKSIRWTNSHGGESAANRGLIWKSSSSASLWMEGDFLGQGRGQRGGSCKRPHCESSARRRAPPSTLSYRIMRRAQTAGMRVSAPLWCGPLFLHT